MTLDQCLGHPLVWLRTEQAEFPFTVSVADEAWLIRLNDFPVEPLYSLIIDGHEIGDFDDWPTCWQRPD